MSAVATLRRARAMTASELAFRSSSAIRIWRDRMRHRIAAPSWNRHALASKLSVNGPALRDAARFMRSGEWQLADDALAKHFRTRSSPWPIRARDRESVTQTIASRFPAARSQAVSRGDLIVEGRYDLLGYRRVLYGRSPDWHLDAVHGRRAPRAFWADVPYLDADCGDHKITWELNRHQHWTSLGRAFWLDGNPAYAQAFVDQLCSWIAANPPLTGVNWASMLELAFRTISWTWALELFGGTDASLAGGKPWRIDLLLALDRQLAHIAQNLSRYFSPNTHLSGEALALYVVSLAVPELRDSAARAALGRDVLVRETRRQILPDGGHAERSTHYHRYSTDFYLFATIVARRCGDPAAAQLAESALAQANVLRTLADDGGGLQTLGDDDGGQLFAMCGTAPSDVRTTLAIAAHIFASPALAVSPPTEESCWVAGIGRARETSASQPAAPWGSRVLPDTGYFVSRARGALAIFDVGRHGFLNGGHAHADALALVVTLGGKPLLIDPGTGTYTMDATLRDRLRSGRMHNTVLLDGREHANARGPFHWSEATDAKLLIARVDDRCDIAQGMHDGYAELRHVRTVFAVHGIGWLVVDQVTGSGPHSAESFWHIDPSWTPRLAGRTVLLNHADGRRSSLTSSASTIEIVAGGPDAICAPEYGRIEAAPVVRTVREGAAPLAFATFVAADPALEANVALAVSACHVAAEWDGVMVHVAAHQLDIRVMAAAPRRRADGAEAPAWPGIRYGAPDLQTNGRAAIRVRQEGAAWHRVVDGTELIEDDAAGADAQELAVSVRDGAR